MKFLFYYFLSVTIHRFWISQLSNSTLTFIDKVRNPVIFFVFNPMNILYYQLSRFSSITIFQCNSTFKFVMDQVCIHTVFVLPYFCYSVCELAYSCSTIPSYLYRWSHNLCVCYALSQFKSFLVVFYSRVQSRCSFHFVPIHISFRKAKVVTSAFTTKKIQTIMIL